MFFTAAASLLDYTTLLGGVVDEATAAISQSTPLAVKVFAMILGIGIGIKVVRKVAK